jgi:nucleotide-binding universal stress UspA family protein
MWKKILVGYDGSRFAKKAVEKSEKIALNNNSELIIVNVYRELVTKSYSISLLEQVKENISEELKVKTVAARSTDVDEELIEIADEKKANLIVVGSRGRSEAGAVLLGSVSHSIATSAPIDVLIVRN